MERHREKCRSVRSADLEVVLGTFPDVDSFQSLQWLGQEQLRSTEGHGETETGRDAERHREMRRGTKRRREVQTDTERDAAALGRWM